MRTSRPDFRSFFSRQAALTVALACGSLLGLSGCTRPTAGFCNIDEQCDFGQFCSLPAHECTTAVVIRGVFSGGQIVPPTASGASGTFMMVVNADSTMGTYTLNHSVTGVTAIDMYQGKVGLTGIPTNKLDTNAMTGTMPLDPDFVRALKVGNYFLQISSTAVPTGEVRAQLFSSDPVDTSEKVPLDGILSGLQQSPPNASPGTGRVHMELDESTQNVTYNYSFNGLQGTVNGIHIHAGGFNINGPHICDLPASTSQSVNGTLDYDTIRACITDSKLYLAQKHLWRIILKSGDAYLNIHSDLFAKGELRGQLRRSPAVPFGVVLNPVAGSGSMASGTATFYLSADQTMLAYNLATDKVVGVTSAVLTRGSGGQELACTSLTASGGKDKSQGYCKLELSPTQVTDVGVADLTSKNLYLRIKSTARPNGELEGQLILPTG